MEISDDRYLHLELKVGKLEAENAALRAAVKEMERMLPVIDKIEDHPSTWEWANYDTGIATANAYRQTLEIALAKINENK